MQTKNIRRVIHTSSTSMAARASLSFTTNQLVACLSFPRIVRSYQGTGSLEQHRRAMSYSDANGGLLLSAPNPLGSQPNRCRIPLPRFGIACRWWDSKSRFYQDPPSNPKQDHVFICSILDFVYIIFPIDFCFAATPKSI